MTTRKWGEEFIVNTQTTGSQDQPAVTGLSDGGFMVAWRDDNPADSRIRMQRFDAKGAALGSEILVSTSDGDDTAPALTQLSDGNLYVVNSDVFVAFGDADTFGRVIGLDGSFIRNQIASAISNNEVTPAVASLGTNGSVVVWKDVESQGGDIMFSIFGTNGTGSAPAVVNAGSTVLQEQREPVVAANRAGTFFAVAWRDLGADLGSDIRASVFNSSGSQVVAEFTVNSITPESQFEPAIAWLDNQRFVVTWSTQTNINNHQDGSINAVKYAIFGVSSNPVILGERLANSTVAGSQSGSVVTALPDGGFAIAWVDTSATGGDSAGTAIRLQVFDGAGEKRGSEVLVNTSTTGNQFDVAISALSDGRVVVTWTDDGASDGSGRSIGAQIIDPRDGLVEGTPAADTLYGHDAAGDVLSGYDGADVLNGLGGDDVGYGGADADTFNGGRGDDTAYGGLGVDNLRGNNGDDVLVGNAGNDTLRGGKDDDELSGGADNDTLIGGAGADALDGGAGTDTANYSDATTGVTMSLDGTLAGAGDAAGDTFADIENVTGSTSGDTLRGNNLANTLAGGAGSDTLDGAIGSDRIFGGASADTLTGGLGNDTFVYTAQTEGGDTITDFVSGGTGNNDRFEFRGSAFGTLPAGNLLTSQFQDTNISAAANINVRFIYNQATGQLLFDADGNQAGGVAAILVATLTPGTDVALNDFAIV